MKRYSTRLDNAIVEFDDKVFKADIVACFKDMSTEEFFSTDAGDLPIIPF